MSAAFKSLADLTEQLVNPQFVKVRHEEGFVLRINRNLVRYYFRDDATNCCCLFMMGDGDAVPLSNTIRELDFIFGTSSS